MDMEPVDMEGWLYVIYFLLIFILSDCVCVCVCVCVLNNTLKILFLLHCISCGILVPRPGIEPADATVESGSFNQWTTREAP